MRQGPSACAVFHPCESHVDLTRRAAIHRRSALARHITLDASTRVAVATQKAACSICTCMASSSSHSDGACCSEL